MSVSVVLPVFNGATTIRRAIRSILQQSYRDLELIVVDDGSTDATVTVVQEHDDPRLRLLQIRHQGVAMAANVGTRMARFPHIARMDADDYSHPSRIEKQLQLLNRDQLDAVGCQIQVLDKDQNRIASMRRYEDWINQETRTSDQITALRFVELPLVNPSILARRAYFELQFATNHLPEDYDLFLRAAAKGMRFGKVCEPLLDWIDHPSGLTRTDIRYTPEAFMECRRIHLLAGPLSAVETVDFWGIGKTGKPWMRWLHAQGIHIRYAYTVAPRKVGQTIHRVQTQHTSALPPADGTPLLIAVGAAGARESILPQIQAKQYQIGHDAWFVA